MACGLPVVATDVGVFNDVIVEGETGTVVSGVDPEVVEEAVRRFVADPAYLDVPSPNAREMSGAISPSSARPSRPRRSTKRYGQQNPDDRAISGNSAATKSTAIPMGGEVEMEVVVVEVDAWAEDGSERAAGAGTDCGDELGFGRCLDFEWAHRDPGAVR